MSYFVVVPGALVPASIAPSLLARAKAPRLASRVQRAEIDEPLRMAGDGAAHLEWLWTQFGGAERRPVTAPYAWRALNRASAIEIPSEQPLWHADPVHFAFARDHMLVTGLDSEATLTPEESRDLAAEAAQIAATFDATLRVFDASHWFLSFDPPWSLETVGYDAALGRSAQLVLPSGESAARWRKVLTEIQIAWHGHPINEGREAAGVRAVNGVWLHGGGVWKALSKRPFEMVATDDPTVRGWSLASGLAPSALIDAGAKPARVISALVYWPELLRYSAHEDWDGWLGALTRFDSEIENHAGHAFAHGFADVTLVLAGREAVHCVRLRRSDRVRFWRNHSLVRVLAEDELA